MSILITIIVGGLIGWAAGAITGRGVPFGIIGNIIAGLIGANLGTWLLGSVGPQLGGFHIIPALLGAIILVLIVSAILRTSKV
ncbi:GlsB/YeaQ/YmgE family stress response membrane protein [Shouchella shacheensis]|uniref:GlsB/YeaQ/YmgE family stress response membrane protein n=1 Tax=Shouchella shacheensis TaxID=1649580 RepID=UPI00073FF905|nr:GlsB/YeaQ/YmgE family stress response membrane protein [Shouchella shacheensis]